ncbi:hypothetical protein [Paenibacillus sp. GXUN7292]|uniref:hypothetical protein n=1 Tax=Paenibacillus sp. GXUN7292 TaxID=3422499 RepID=UPI003D7D7507
MKIQPMIIALILIITSSVGIGIWNNKMQLQEPIFLKQYTDHLAYWQEGISIQFVENSETRNPVQWVEIEGLENIAKMSDIRVLDTYPQQLLKEIQLTITTSDEARLEQLVGQSFHKGKAHLKDGTTQQFDLGKVQLRSAKGNDNDPLESMSSGSSSNNEGFIIWRAKEAITVTHIHISESELLQEHLLVSLANNKETADGIYGYPADGNVNVITQTGKPFYELPLPIQVEKDEALRLEYKFTNFHQPVNVLQNIVIEGINHTTNENFIYTSGFIQYYGNRNSDNIAKLLKETRARQ